MLLAIFKGRKPKNSSSVYALLLNSSKGCQRNEHTQDEAETLMKKVKLLNIEKISLTHKSEQINLLMMAQDKKMALCETYGSFLIANADVERTQSYVTSKQHVGYGMVRDFLSEYKATREKAREEERLAKEKEAQERRKQKEKKYDRMFCPSEYFWFCICLECKL
ncbi:unnamed protein product [Cuscuta epithymum]|uniref:Uncharacterized protein n=1 Tax=Cuscuta epithymum TaxID=186058 RepID=A0AAV0C6B5_9ASTE|nr:unnamed protein product [Cuscuta epithymum]